MRGELCRSAETPAQTAWWGFRGGKGWWVSDWEGASEDSREREDERMWCISPFLPCSRSFIVTKVHARFQLPGLGLQLPGQALGPALSTFSYSLHLGPHIPRVPLNSSLCRTVAELGLHPLTPRDMIGVWFVFPSVGSPSKFRLQKIPEGWRARVSKIVLMSGLRSTV